MNSHVPVRIQTGAPVRIDGREFSAGPVISGGRVFFDKEAGEQIVLSEIAQMRMALDFRLQDNKQYDGLSAARQHALSIDWGTFTPVERAVALERALYVRKLDKVAPANQRSKKRVIEKIIEQVATIWKIPPARWPSPRRVRVWYRIFVTCGRDVRALVDCNWAKGNREPRYSQWALEEINTAIDENIAVQTPASYHTTKRLADQKLRERAKKEGLVLHARGKDNTIGQNLVARLVRGRDRFDLLVAQVTEPEARRQMQVVELGPQGSEVNFEWEVDHTLLDIFVIDPETGKSAGRPWMTAIIDRYSRCIVGFSLSFAPPSWTSVMDALRIAIIRKEKVLHHLPGIKNTWECYGVPKYLITDHGRDFKSTSLEETARALGFELRHMKPKKPWLKGKVERWFRTLQDEIVHTAPGTTFSKWEGRKFYNSENYAVLTIEELNWIVAKWTVDVYHQEIHSKLRRSPAEMWKQGLPAIPLPRHPPLSLLKPLMGLVLARTLGKSGVKYLGLRWDSEEFSQLRRRLPSAADVLIRIDPLDLNSAYVFDNARQKWVEGHLKEPVEARGYTLDQWLKVDALRKTIQNEDEKSREQALGEAMADIKKYIEDVKAGRIKSKAPKRLAAFKNRTTWDKVLPSRWAETDEPPFSHEIGVTRIKSPSLAPSGPFSEVRHKPSQDDQNEDDEYEVATETAGAELPETDGLATPLQADPDLDLKTSAKAPKNVKQNGSASKEAAEHVEHTSHDDDDDSYDVVSGD